MQQPIRQYRLITVQSTHYKSQAAHNTNNLGYVFVVAKRAGDEAEAAASGSAPRSLRCLLLTHRMYHSNAGTAMMIRATDSMSDPKAWSATLSKGNKMRPTEPALPVNSELSGALKSKNGSSLHSEVPHEQAGVLAPLNHNGEARGNYYICDGAAHTPCGHRSYPQPIH
jgi:hypothetical protein